MLNVQSYRSTMHYQNQATQEDIDNLISQLDSSDGLIAQHARHSLIRIGGPAVKALVEAFENNRDSRLHWEAAKALSQIGSPEATQSFIRALQDDNFGVRWLAAEGLITIGRPAVKPLLKALESQADSVRLREGAHHVLHDMVHQLYVDKQMRQHLRPVLDALNGVEPAMGVPVAAQKALQQIEG